MKLSEALQLKKALEKTWEINETLPGPFEHVSKRILTILRAEVSGLQESAKARASKGLGKDEKPDEKAVQKELDALLQEFWDEELALRLPRIKPEWLPEKVMKGTSAALEPVMDSVKEPSASFIEKMIKAKEKKAEKSGKNGKKKEKS